MNNQINPLKITGRSIAFIALLWFIFSSFYIVEPGQVGFTKTLGAISSDIKLEGLQWKTPFISDAVIMSIRDIKDETTASSASKDLQDVSSTIAVNYSLKPTETIALYQSIGDNDAIEDVLIAPTIQESIKSVTAKYTAGELVTSRTEVRGDIIDQLTMKLEPRGILVREVNIVNFQFSSSFNAAIEAKVQAEQEAQKAENDLKRVQFESQQEVARAEAEAEKIRIQASAITSQGGAEYVQLQAIQKWDGVMPRIVTGESGGMFINLTE